AQREYLLARETERRLQASSLPEARASAASLARASRERLRLWDLSPQQVRELEESGQARRTLTIHSPISGTVIEKTAVAGLRVEPGMTLYRIADLSTVWAYGDVYEYELPLVKVGQQADLALTAYPAERFTARVAWVSPVVDSESKLQAAESMMGMMGALGMGGVKMESARPMEMGGGEAPAPPGALPAGEKQVGDLRVAVFPARETATVGENAIRVRVRDAA